jgi:exopolyphosphatase/guanosine-5'-triphosphate,3'-diphosphate pyrophosphatase
VKVASIDVGSYSCRLSIADFSNSFRIIYEEGNITALATGLKETGYLQEEPMKETLQTIKKYIQVAKQHGAERIVLVGTEALRRAKNSQEFLKRVKEETGLELKVITPEEEGRLAFLAVAFSLKPEGKFCIIDQGGGSTEFVCGKGTEVEYLKSLPVGIVNLTEEFIQSDPPKPYELESLRNFLDELIKDAVRPCDVLVGLGGTITTVSAIKNNVFPYQGSLVHGSKLTLEDIMFWLETLSGMKAEDRVKTFPHIEPKRAKVIVPGLMIFYRAMLLFGKREIVVSDWGIKEGVLIREYLSLGLG